MLVHQLVGRRLAIFNSIHGGKDDLLFHLKMGFQITLKEADNLPRPLTEPTHVGLMILEASMNAQAHEQTIVMLAGQRDEAFMTPVRFHIRPPLQARPRAGTRCCSRDEYV